MLGKQLGIIATVVCFLSLASCTSTYQNLLRDRDAQIHKLDGEVANLRAANDDLARREKAARSESENLQAQFVAKAAEAVSATDEIARLQKTLGSDVEVTRRRGRISMGIESTVTFDSGSVSLLSSAGPVLSRITRVLKSEFPEQRIYVEGHTDVDPIRKTKSLFRSNRHLSTERADAVASWLVSKGGIADDQVVVVGYGPHDPRDPGKSKKAKARNRRVEIVIGDSL